MKRILAIMLVFMLISTGIVIATPTGFLNNDEIQDYRRSDPSEKTDSAKAGNVTEINASFLQVTKSWAGYYGNVTGTIVLDNSDNMSMYDWSVATPSGTIFAVNQSVTSWSNVQCFNYSNKGTEINLSHLESSLGCNGSDDCVDETFNTNTHATITVGTNTFTNVCNATKTYVNDGASTDFDEALLYEPDANLVIYATVIQDNQNGFDNTPADFQLLVGENGHGSAASTTTPYYFYIELV